LGVARDGVCLQRVVSLQIRDLPYFTWLDLCYNQMPTIFKHSNVLGKLLDPCFWLDSSLCRCQVLTQEWVVGLVSQLTTVPSCMWVGCVSLLPCHPCFICSLFCLPSLLSIFHFVSFCFGLTSFLFVVCLYLHYVYLCSPQCFSPRLVFSLCQYYHDMI